MRLSTLLNHPAPWLTGLGDGDDIALYTRISLARNLPDQPFPGWSLPEHRQAVLNRVLPVLQELPELKNGFYSEISDLPLQERHLLLERQLISTELAARDAGCAVAVSRNQSLDILINEEDHLRLRLYQSGCDIPALWAEMDRLDTWIENRLQYAYDAQLGHLTSCPSNLGTGLRITVALHLPGISMANLAPQLMNAAEKLNITIRSLYGDGPEAFGNVYQISNKSTLGQSEEEIVTQMAAIVNSIAERERQIRLKLLQRNFTDVIDRVGRSVGTLHFACSLSCREAAEHLSYVRLGAALGLVNWAPAPQRAEAREQLPSIALHILPAHLKKAMIETFGDRAEESDQQTLRAFYIHKNLCPALPYGAKEPDAAPTND